MTRLSTLFSDQAFHPHSRKTMATASVGTELSSVRLERKDSQQYGQKLGQQIRQQTGHQTGQQTGQQIGQDTTPVKATRKCDRLSAQLLFNIPC